MTGREQAASSKEGEPMAVTHLSWYRLIDSRPGEAFHTLALSRARTLLDLDRLDEALAAAHWGRAAAVETGAWSAIAECQVAIGSVYDARGDVDAAVAAYEAAVELADQVGTDWQLAAYGALARIAIRRDDLDEAARLLEEAESRRLDPFDQPGLVWAAAELLAARGRPAAALSVLAGAPVDGSLPLFVVDAVRIAMAEGDRELAATLTDATRRFADRVDTPSAWSIALRCQGIVHADLDAYLSAVDAAANSSRPLVRAGAHEDAGHALAANGRSDEARRHFAAALDASEQLGAVRDVGRIAAIARGFGIRHGQRGRRRRPTHGWDSLTSTELRVADLVAAGLSNPAIGERMFLSRRTVQSHVSHILTKTGLTSRVALAAAVASRASASPMYRASA
jgi:DNA-binding CsgD family transcriptional regulator/predicted negative regulator of RcsB-dependent stress response